MGTPLSRYFKENNLITLSEIHVSFNHGFHLRETFCSPVPHKIPSAFIFKHLRTSFVSAFQGKIAVVSWIPGKMGVVRVVIIFMLVFSRSRDSFAAEYCQALFSPS
ncbi:MAG: hypothetical protein K8S55_07000 [Phycisphaerae bacterium]|nr:hypothetical protein [Phycisphaerae bacterium]